MVVGIVRAPRLPQGGRGARSGKVATGFPKDHAQTIELRGHSSAGRGLAGHARGRRFDPAWLHHASPFGLRVAQPRRSRKDEAWCPAKPLGEDGLERPPKSSNTPLRATRGAATPEPEGRSVVPGEA